MTPDKFCKYLDDVKRALDNMEYEFDQMTRELDDASENARREKARANAAEQDLARVTAGP